MRSCAKGVCVRGAKTQRAAARAGGGVACRVRHRVEDPETTSDTEKEEGHVISSKLSTKLGRKSMSANA